MVPEGFRWLAGVIAAHRDRQVVGRTRLQKTVRLLQRVGLPTGYRYMIHFYGPYSEGLQADIRLLEQLGLVREQEHDKEAQDGSSYYVLRATEEAELAQIAKYQGSIRTIEDADPVALELAATYDAFRETGCEHSEAIDRLRRKKSDKCAGANVQEALELLSALGLPAA